MAVSMVVLAVRPPDWTVDQFTAWWRGDHAAMARRLPGLLAYRHGRVTDDYDHPDAPGWDGHAVLTFADRTALDAALASPEWADAVRHTGRMKGKRLILITDEVDLLVTGGHSGRK
ncbi:MAG: EthD family reductase [Pseudomonadota bacterium]|nr:EthD family reductase [Pseudomonadota bacterium]